jgi:hypothetical protein
VAGADRAGSNAYHFDTRWRVPGTVDEVAAVLGDTAELGRWWPSVYLDVRELSPGDEQGLGKEVDLYTKGWLPYTLRWRFRVVEQRWPHSLTLVASGDFVGRGVWTLTQDGPWVDVRYEWDVRADKPLLRRLSFLLRPLFAANHRWAMAQGEASLRLELARRRARTSEERGRLPRPPGPTPAWVGASLTGVLVVLLGLGLLALWALLRRGRPAPG